MNNNMIRQIYNIRFEINRLLKMNISYCYNKPLNCQNKLIKDNLDIIKDNLNNIKNKNNIELKEDDIYNSLDMKDIPIIKYDEKKYDHFNKPLYD